MTAWAVLVKDGIDESYWIHRQFLSGTDPEEYCGNDRNPEDLESTQRNGSLRD